MLLGVNLLLCYLIKQNGIGKNLIKIGRFEPSTKTCSNCGSITKLELDDRIWTCGSCNDTHDRDINAAINIKNIGLKAGMKCPAVSVEKKKINSSNRAKKSCSEKQKVILLEVSK